MRYTKDEKHNILQQLDRNFGDVPLTSAQLGVPTRTLYAWRRARKLERAAVQQEKVPAPQHNSAAKPNEDLNTSEGVYTHIRDRLMTHINTLLDHLMDDPDTAHMRIMALSRLLDRVIKLEAYAASEQREHIVTIEYKYPDGSIHDVPPWQKNSRLDDPNDLPTTSEELFKRFPETYGHLLDDFEE